MKHELRIFFTALMFYTRIPCPPDTDHSPEYINKATRYFPLIGWIVGAISFNVFILSSFLFNNEIAVVIALLAAVLITGAFHEDGLADVFDGFGGGWTKPKILEIMKDSRVGAYGVYASIFLILLKTFGLIGLLNKIHDDNYYTIGLVFISYHSLARWSAINLVFTSQYARADESSKAKPIAQQHTYKEVLGAYIFGLLPLAVLSALFPLATTVLFPLIILFVLSKRYYEKWLGGYTGDCLGAVEQFAELIIILSYFIIWKFIY
jgi:adenosylcobinamide-GDP ribazoletransferase